MEKFGLDNTNITKVHLTACADPFPPSFLSPLPLPEVEQMILVLFTHLHNATCDNRACDTDRQPIPVIGLDTRTT